MDPPITPQSCTIAFAPATRRCGDAVRRIGVIPAASACYDRIGKDFLKMGRYDRDRWRRHRHHGGHGGLVGGVILAGIGVVLLLQNLGIPYFEDLERFWPL